METTLNPASPAIVTMSIVVLVCCAGFASGDVQIVRVGG